MSDEESFVVLGSCSAKNFLEINESLCDDFQSFEISKIEKDSIDAKTPDASLGNKDEKDDAAHQPSNNSLERSVENNQSVPIENSTPMNHSAESADELKANVYSQFPSICSMEACAEDVIKLQNFMSEYNELKSTLSIIILQYKTQWENCQTDIATLRRENLALKLQMRTNMEEIKIADDLKKKEVTEMVQLISEKTALVDNLRAQIKYLEKQNLAAFQYLSKHGQDGKQSSDYIARSEHLLQIKEKDRKMSELLAESLAVKDMQRIYVEKINCLKVNLTSAEELLQQSRRDIELLKASDLEKSKRFTEYETDRDKIREDILVLRQQVDVNGKDFQIERSARETLAGEQDQLLQDLRSMLRYANPQLIENQNRVLNNTPNNGYQNDANKASRKCSNIILQYKAHLENCQTEIATLRKENLALKLQMRSDMEQIKIADDLKKKNTSMIQLISIKTELVENLRAQIKHLETQNPFVLSPFGQYGKQNSDYIARSIHLHDIKEKDRKMSELLAESLDLKDMKKKEF